MRIALTNDDGFDAPGLAALYRAVRTLPGIEVRVIAPAVAYSGKGHVVSPQFSCHDTQVPGIGRVTVVDGTPGDCVRAAMALPGEPRPDWVIGGINYGSNLGIDVYYSGTVAAAREAVILGIPSIAVSQLVKSNTPTDWAATACVVAAILAGLVSSETTASAEIDSRLHRVVAEHVLKVGSKAGFWNVNLPLRIERDTPLEFTSLSTDPYHVLYEETRDENDRLCLISKGNYHERPAAPGTDVAAVFGGNISLTRLSL